eukprot:6921096-Pyramimonas_sp.AAC.1
MELRPAPPWQWECRRCSRGSERTAPTRKRISHAPGGVRAERGTTTVHLENNKVGACPPRGRPVHILLDELNSSSLHVGVRTNDDKAACL